MKFVLYLIMMICICATTPDAVLNISYSEEKMSFDAASSYIGISSFSATKDLSLCHSPPVVGIV